MEIITASRLLGQNQNPGLSVQIYDSITHLKVTNQQGLSFKLSAQCILPPKRFGCPAG